MDSKSRLIKKMAGDIYYNARQIADKNRRLFEKGKVDDCVFFDYKGYRIFDPFKDEKGENEVDPKEYYKDAYVHSGFNKVN